MLSVLIVDDDADTADMLAELLESYGCRVRVACSGRDALIVLDAERPDLVFLDIELPDMLGYEVAPAIRRRCGGDVRLIAFSGLPGAAPRERARAAGCERFVGKPFRSSDIKAALGNIARQARAARQN
jgi:hypothetical protein